MAAATGMPRVSSRRSWLFTSVTWASTSSRVRTTTPSASCSQRIVLLMSYSSDSLDDGGDAHAAADAQGGQAAAQVAPLELVDERAQDHRAGGAQRVPHRDGA